ncbi:MAG: YHYH protein [Colwellia sp.]|nr:YHYH protein [Colwellia sp.]
MEKITMNLITKQRRVNMHNDKNSLFKNVVIITPLVFALQACGSSSEDDIDSTDNTVTETITDTTTETIDITNVIFTERSGDCADYTNTYEAEVTDITNGTGFEADVDISSDESTCTLVSNAIPNHDFNTTGHFASTVSTQSLSYQIDRNPTSAENTTALSQGTSNGLMLNGVILDLLSAGCYDPSSSDASDGSQGDDEGITPIGCAGTHPWLADPLGVFHKFGADEHNAHTQPDGEYHYHGSPNAMFDDNPGSEGSPVIGFAADGFPIYGSYFYDAASDTVREAKSGYTLKAARIAVDGYETPSGIPDGKYLSDWEFTNTGDLDACNGMTINGQYGYYAINEYPWVMSCFTGTANASFNK